jgi:hypothetical protein
LFKQTSDGIAATKANRFNSLRTSMRIPSGLASRLLTWPVKEIDRRAKIMGQEILVAIKSEDRLSQLIPYIEKVAQPGMRVVFLIRFIANSAAKPLLHDSIELECAEKSHYGEEEQPTLRAKNVDEIEPIEERRLLAEHKVFLALEALVKKGIEITVDVYTGSLRRALKTHTSKGSIHIIMMRATRKRILIDFLHKAFPVLRLSKHATFSPVLVLHPTQAI